MNRALPMLVFAAPLVGCARTEPQLLVPADVDVAWDASCDGVGDGRVAIIPVDVMLYDANSGDALADVVVTVSIPDGEAGVVGENDVIVAAPEDGVWDVRRDRWVALPSDQLAPSMQFRTDATGLVRLDIVVDAFFDEPILVIVSAAGLEAGADDEFVVVPQ